MPATEARKMSLEELFEKRASQQMISEANAFKTVDKGMYRLRASKYDISETNYDGNLRTTIWFSVDILDNEGKRLAKGSIKISPDEVRTKKGNQDTQTKLFGQMAKALFPDLDDEGRAGISAAEVVQTFMTTPVDGFVAKQYQGPKDPQTGYPTWVNSDTEAEELECKKKGYKAVNIIRSVQKAN